MLLPFTSVVRQSISKTFLNYKLFQSFTTHTIGIYMRMNTLLFELNAIQKCVVNFKFQFKKLEIWKIINKQITTWNIALP